VITVINIKYLHFHWQHMCADRTVKRTIPRSNVTGGLFVSRVVPRPGVSVAPSQHYHNNEFTDEELKKMDLNGAMVTLAHNLAYSQTHVGNVVDSWMHDGTLYATSTLFEAPNGIAAVGKIRSLNTANVSLGHATIRNKDTGTDTKHAFELTLCETPRRNSPVLLAIDHVACDALFNVGPTNSDGISRAAVTTTDKNIIDSDFNLITLNTRASAWPANTTCVSAKNCETLGWSACNTHSFRDLLQKFGAPIATLTPSSSTTIIATTTASANNNTQNAFGTPQNPSVEFLLALRRLTVACIEMKEQEQYNKERAALSKLARPYFTQASMSLSPNPTTGSSVDSQSSGASVNATDHVVLTKGKRYIKFKTDFFFFFALQLKKRI
jgi:hypothetical protein